MHTLIPQTLAAVTGDYATACLLPLVSDTQIHCVLYFPNQLDADRLARAVRLSFDAEPILGCKLVFKHGRLVWQRRDFEQADYFRLVESQDTEAEVKRFLCQPLDAFQDAVAQVRLIRAEADALVLKVSHIAADGAAVKAYAYLLTDIYRQLTENPNYTPAVNQGSRSLKQLGRVFSLADKFKILRRSWRNSRDMMFPPKNWQLPLQTAEEQADYVWRKIEAAQFRALKAYAKKHGATLNDILLTTLFRALHQQIKPPATQVLRLVNTADLRRYLPTRQAEAICNLSGFVYLNIGTELGDGFADTLAKVSTSMTRLKNDYPGLGDVPSWVLFYRYLPFSWNRALLRNVFKPGKTVMPPGLTNIGPINASRLDFGIQPHAAFMTASVVFAPYLLLGISSFGETLHISAGFTGGEANRKVIEALLDAMQDELNTVVLQPS